MTLLMQTSEENEQLHPIVMTHFPLENILVNDDVALRSENIRKIFFIESHTESERDLKNARQACSVESAGNKKKFN